MVAGFPADVAGELPALPDLELQKYKKNGKKKKNEEKARKQETEFRVFKKY